VIAAGHVVEWHDEFKGMTPTTRDFEGSILKVEALLDTVHAGCDGAKIGQDTTLIQRIIELLIQF
jgi:hypothetical protein